MHWEVRMEGLLESIVYAITPYEVLCIVSMNIAQMA